MSLSIVGLSVLGIIVAYFSHNPLRHDRWFIGRRFINWFPLGMTYAFLCMGRYNLIVAKGALGTLMTKEDLGIIFGVGTWTYALSFLINGPLIDRKLGGKQGIIIAAIGAALANALLAGLTWLILNQRIHVKLALAYSVLYAVNMYFQSYGAMSIIKVKAYWFHVRERGVFGAIFGTLISAGVYLAFDWGSAIVAMTKVTPAADGGAIQSLLRRVFVPANPTVDATWAVFLIPAAFLIILAVLDIWMIRDTPEEAGFAYFDTCDASSGQMHVELSVMDLLRKIFASPLMLIVAGVELTSGVFRYSMTEWFPVFASEMKVPGSGFFLQNWGLLLFIFGVIGGFSAGIISDRWFRSRRGPPCALMCAIVLILASIMALTLFSAPQLVGWSAVLIVMASIGITSLMSGTAATDFGGRKATATSAGIVDGFAYLGSGMQSIGLGYITSHNWHWWPVFVLPFAILGLYLATRIWSALPAATQKYIEEKEEVVESRESAA